MTKKLLFLSIFLFFALCANGQKRNYNCIILDSIFNAIKVKKAQNDFLLPLFKSGEIKTDGDTIYRIIIDKVRERKIDSVIRTVNVKERTWFLNDVLFSLDTLNVIIDTFGFFDNSCNLCKDNNRLIVSDYRMLNMLKETCNVIIVQQIAYNRSGAISIALRNSKSNYAVVIGVRQQSANTPRISIVGKHLFDPEDGLIIE